MTHFDSEPHSARFFPDDTQLDAQVPAQVSPSQGERHPQAALLDVSDVRLQGDRVHRSHRLSEREGKEWLNALLAITRIINSDSQLHDHNKLPAIISVFRLIYINKFGRKIAD